MESGNLNPLLLPLQGFNFSRFLLVVTGALGLAFIYVFQFTDVATAIGIHSESYVFIVNKTLRYFLNDVMVILILWGLFKKKQLIWIACIIQLIGLFILLPIYFSLKLNFEGTSEISSPLLSFLHRLIVNPILLILLIPSYYFQTIISKHK